MFGKILGTVTKAVTQPLRDAVDVVEVSRFGDEA